MLLGRELLLRRILLGMRNRARLTRVGARRRKCCSRLTWIGIRRLGGATNRKGCLALGTASLFPNQIGRYLKLRLAA